MFLPKKKDAYSFDRCFETVKIRVSVIIQYLEYL